MITNQKGTVIIHRVPKGTDAAGVTIHATAELKCKTEILSHVRCHAGRGYRGKGPHSQKHGRLMLMHGKSCYTSKDPIPFLSLNFLVLVSS
jgi:hypothetical protein